MTALKEEQEIRSTIMSILSNGDETISGLHKEISKRGLTMHRLVLTGYLRALKEMGLLDEKEIKPSKVYSLGKRSESDIYSVVGRISLLMDEERAPEVALHILYDLFERPIFMREIERCNVGSPRAYRRIIPEDRIHYLDKLNKSGIIIPQNSYMVEPNDDPNWSQDQVFKKILFETFDLKRLARDIAKGPQRTL